MAKACIILYSLMTLTILSCGRTSSRSRFSENMDISIPKSVEVIQDEYQDMLQDYVINYQLKLGEANCLQLTESILNSDFYNESGVYIKQNEVVGVWQRDSVGYTFTSKVTRRILSAEIDTIRLIARFTESYD